MSLLYRALSQAAKEKETGESEPAPKLVATTAERKEADERKEKERGTGAPLRRGTIAALMVVTAAVASGVILWPEIETQIAPLMDLIRASPPPPRPAPSPAPEARPAAPTEPAPAPSPAAQPAPAPEAAVEAPEPAAAIGGETTQAPEPAPPQVAQAEPEPAADAPVPAAGEPVEATAPTGAVAAPTPEPEPRQSPAPAPEEASAAPTAAAPGQPVTAAGEAVEAASEAAVETPPTATVDETVAALRPEAAVAPPSRGRPGGYWAHLASVRTERSGLDEWDRLRRRHTNLLGAFGGAVLADVDLGGDKGVWLHVLAGPLSDLAALDALCDKLHARGAYCAQAGLALETLAEAPSPAPAAPAAEEASPAPASAQPGAAEPARTLESVVDEAASAVSGLIAPEQTPTASTLAAAQAEPTTGDAPPPPALKPLAPEAERAPADGPVNVDALVAAQEEARTPEAGREPILIERSQRRPSSEVSRMVTVVNESDYVRDRHAAARRTLGAGQTEGALTIYEDLLGRYPNDRLALLGKANALHRLGRIGDAIRVYEETLSRYPDEMAALTNLLGLIGRQSPQNALGRLRRLYRVNPGFGPVAAQLALIHAQLGDDGNALRYMKEAVALEPRNVVYQVNVAIMADRAGDKREAVRAYERTLELIAGDTTALPISPRAIRDRLRYLRAN